MTAAPERSELANDAQRGSHCGCSDLLAAVQDLSTEIYGGKLNFREVPTDTFVAWYQWRLKEQPNTETGIPLKDFDLESAMMFFEDFVKAANDEVRDRAT